MIQNKLGECEGGTYSWSAPEMYQGAICNEKTDIYDFERWKDFSVLFDSGLIKLPAVKCIVYRWVFHSVTALK